MVEQRASLLFYFSLILPLLLPPSFPGESKQSFIFEQAMCALLFLWIEHLKNDAHKFKLKTHFMPQEILCRTEKILLLCSLYKIPAGASLSPFAQSVQMISYSSA